MDAAEIGKVSNIARNRVSYGKKPGFSIFPLPPTARNRVSYGKKPGFSIFPLPPTARNRVSYGKKPGFSIFPLPPTARNRVSYFKFWKETRFLPPTSLTKPVLADMISKIG
jgi:hypothetical protein